jgi:hypothetical protein
LKKNLVLEASDEGIVAEWWSTPRWNMLEVYLSIRIKIPRWCTDEGNSLYGTILLVAAIIWNLLHLT